MTNIHTYYTDDMHSWSFCYLHGKAEQVFDQGWATDEDYCAPDLFSADQPKPTEEGSYAVMIDGQPAVAVLAATNGPDRPLGGRVSLVTDMKALKHALSPEDWR